MVAVYVVFVSKSMLRKECPTQWHLHKTKFATLKKNNFLGIYAHDMSRLDVKGSLTEFGKRVWFALTSEKKL